VLLAKYNQNYLVAKDEVVGARRAYGGEEVRVQAIGRKDRGKEITRKAKMWVEDIQMDLAEMGCCVVDWIDLAQVIKLRVL
jgi:hypothetical protein